VRGVGRRAVHGKVARRERGDGQSPIANRKWPAPNPYGGREAGKTEVKSNRIKPNQTKSNQIQPNPTESNRIQPNPTESNRIKPNPTKSNRIQQKAEAFSKPRSSRRESAPFPMKSERTHVRCYSFERGSTVMPLRTRAMGDTPDLVLECGCAAGEEEMANRQSPIANGRRAEGVLAPHGWEGQDGKSPSAKRQSGRRHGVDSPSFLGVHPISGRAAFLYRCPRELVTSDL